MLGTDTRGAQQWLTGWTYGLSVTILSRSGTGTVNTPVRQLMRTWRLDTAERLITDALTVRTREWRVLGTHDLSITTIVIVQDSKLDWLAFSVLALEWSLHWALVK